MAWPYPPDSAPYQGAWSNLVSGGLVGEKEKVGSSRLLASPICGLRTAAAPCSESAAAWTRETWIALLRRFGAINTYVVYSYKTQVSFTNICALRRLDRSTIGDLSLWSMH